MPHPGVAITSVFNTDLNIMYVGLEPRLSECYGWQAVSHRFLSDEVLKVREFPTASTLSTRLIWLKKQAIGIGVPSYIHWTKHWLILNLTGITRPPPLTPDILVGTVTYCKKLASSDRSELMAGR